MFNANFKPDANDASMFPTNFTPEPIERVALRIAIKRNPKAGVGRNPTIKGYVIVRTEQARQILAACEAKDDGVIFLDVALWDDHDPEAKYPMAGNIATRHHDRDKAEREAAEAAEAEAPRKSIWY